MKPKEMAILPLSAQWVSVTQRHRLDEKQHHSNALLSSNQLDTFRTSLETRASKTACGFHAIPKARPLGLLAEDTRKMAQAKPRFVPSC